MLDPIARQIVSLIVAAVFGALLSYIKTQRSNTKTAIEVAEKQALNADRAIFTLVKSQIVSEWARVNKKCLICGHTHKSRLKKPGESQYFNDGCCVFPCAISGIEINHGSVLLVKCSIYVKGDNSLQIVRNLVTSPVKLEDYLKVTN